MTSNNLQMSTSEGLNVRNRQNEVNTQIHKLKTPHHVYISLCMPLSLSLSLRPLPSLSLTLSLSLSLSFCLSLSLSPCLSHCRTAPCLYLSVENAALCLHILQEERECWPGPLSRFLELWMYQGWDRWSWWVLERGELFKFRVCQGQGLVK